MNATFTIKGITDATDTCECCGTRIKRAVALMPLDEDGNEFGEAVYYGTSCAGKAVGRKTAWVTRRATAAQRERDAEVERAREWLAAYGPVEFGSTLQKRRVFCTERGNTLRAGESVSRVVAGILATARATLAAAH
ncbi:hypothetical protein ABTY20_23045 [Streptomyces sp. NPDC126497]|uniref:hypothetical protein n=1 Tax=Streptomyces sp. NPDC126497 TaxID=3155313 RepID=UPI003328947F